MGLQSLSEKSVNRVRRQFPDLDIDAIRVSNHGMWLYCRTSEDSHYLLNRRTGEVEPEPFHWTSCKERFGEVKEEGYEEDDDDDESGEENE